MKEYRGIYATLLTIVIELLTFKDQFRGFFPAAVTLLIAVNLGEQLICTFSSYQSPDKTVKCLTSYTDTYI